ncbi:hypothetical protein NCG89_03465 [Spongiibacter taiwanensis]|uniref:RipA family octameric membrane protein n=1 Tax=Spongiibacter taiwanensis TaxID=1748242 RepID=UPI002035F679|nr:hypothetical protein [Spongiibacter taiwanensis]USA43850.1 hypothetical protein NCG89_03465 [Spongiibacter taiwanensis]
MNEPQDNQQKEKELERDVLKSLYELSIETRNFEIGQLIHRNNFFMLFQGVLLASVLQAENSRPMVEFTICFAGLFVSFYQMQMASGAKFWQEWWESRVDHYEVLLEKNIKHDGDKFYKLFTTSMTDVVSTVSSRISGKRRFTNSLILSRYSVGRAPMKVSVVLVFTWMVLLSTTLNWSFLGTFQELIVGFSTHAIE